MFDSDKIMTTLNFVKASIAGIFTPFAALAISHHTVNLWLSSISLIVGILVGLISLYQILKRKRKK